MDSRRRVRLTAFLLATSVARLFGQGQTDLKALAFEVASIKPNTSDAVGVGGVGWGATSERFDINAQLAPGIVFNATTMFQPLMRKLLEDRFQLKIHHETRELNVYRLVRVRADRPDRTLT